MEITLPRILAVDDDEAFRRSLERTLQGLGFEVLVAGGAREAMAILDREAPDLLMLDLQMPGINGHALMRALNRSDVRVPVVVMSGVGDLDDVVQVLRNRAVDYLRKPFSVDDLGAAIDRALAEATPVIPDERGVAPTAPAPGTSVRELLDALKRGDLKLPSLSPLGAQLQQFFHSPPEDVDEVLALLSQDTAVCGNVLNAANSTLYSARRPLQTVREAVLRLGTQRACGVAHELMLRQVFAQQDGPFREVVEAMWSANLVVAEGARELARLLGRFHPDEIHLAALMHNVGELSILSLLGAQWEGPPPDEDRWAALAREIDAEHEALGSWQLSAWNVDPAIVRLAARHHPPVDGPETEDDGVRRRLVHLAWTMTIEIGRAYLPDQDGGDAERQALELGLRHRDVVRLFERFVSDEGEGQAIPAAEGRNR